MRREEENKLTQRRDGELVARAASFARAKTRSCVMDEFFFPLRSAQPNKETFLRNRHIKQISELILRELVASCKLVGKLVG